MEATASSHLSEPSHNEEHEVSRFPPSPSRGLKRMEGTSQLKQIALSFPIKGRHIPVSASLLSQSASMMNVKLDQSSSVNAPLPVIGSKKNGEFGKSSTNGGLTRTSTSATPLKSMFPIEKRGPIPIRIHQSDKAFTPIRFKVEKTPNGTISKATIIPKEVPLPQNFETSKNNGETTPPSLMRRSSSGSMLLRQTPERVRRLEEGEASPKKGLKRSGSMSKSAFQPLVSLITENVASALKRKRTSSLSSLKSSDSSVLTPQRLRPRGISETRIDDYRRTPAKQTRVITVSPTKKRVREETGSRPSSPLKKRSLQSDDCSSSAQVTTPVLNIKQNFNPKAITEHIAQIYGSGTKRPLNTDVCTSSSTIPKNPSLPPKLVTRSTSGETYYSANEEDELTPRSSTIGRAEVFLTPQVSIQSNEKMVPLVKKQISIDEKKSDYGDEGDGESMKTIKRGQGSALARSLSLKLSPRNDQNKSIGVDTEKSCSTPSLPTATLVRHSSTSSLRFKVSPSTFLTQLSNKPVIGPIQPSFSSSAAASFPSSGPSTSSQFTPPAALFSTPSPTTVHFSEPSTSKIVDVLEPKFVMKKSALRSPASYFNVKNDYNGFRQRKLKFTGLNVHYFDRRQGETTLPTEGDVSLDMHDRHHSHRYFSLSSGKRPLLDLTLYDDEELSDGEEIHPDSEDEHDYDEYTSARTITMIKQRHRIKLLKKSGVKVEKNDEAAELRTQRSDCGCTCENGVCLPETCQCSIDGINCQVDGGNWPTHPCTCFKETCTNPKGRTFYDPDAVHQFRQRTIMNWRAAQKIGVNGSPVIKKFLDSEDEEHPSSQKWLLDSIRLEETPTKFPVTPVYTRRSRSNLSDIRESSSEASTSLTPSTSLSERIKAMQHLDNEVCVEEEEKDYEVDKEVTIVEEDITLQEVYIAQDIEAVNADTELLDTAMSPVKTTLVV